MSSLLHAPSGPVDLPLIAGEHSGDEQGARLVRRLRAIRPELKLAALGGECLREAGGRPAGVLLWRECWMLWG